MATCRRILILGGSTEASELARRLAVLGNCDVIVSYAGRTRSRVETPGAVRVGGFGGVDGLVRYLEAESIDVLLDATHPFAARMPHHAAAAGAATGLPHLRVCRPQWIAVEGDRWHHAEDLTAAAALIGELGGRRVFLTTGRQELAPFAAVRDAFFLVRAIEKPDAMPLARAAVVLDRGPFDEESEVALLTEHSIDLVVSKNSGGDASMAKLRAARRLGIPVVMVARPPGPGGPHASTVADALDWLAGLSSTGRG